MDKNKLLIFFAPLVSLALLGPGYALGQSQAAITVLPQKTNIEAVPGDNIRKSLLLINASNNPVSLKVSVKDLKVTNSQGEVSFYDSQDAYPASKWLIPQYDIVTMAPVSSINMDFISLAAKDMPGRGYAGAILFQLYNPDTKETFGNVFGSSVSLNVMSKGITSGGTFSGFKMPMMQYQNPARIEFAINNAGNSNTALNGKISISDIWGKKVSEYELKGLDVYPESSKLFKYNLNNKSLLGIYKAGLTLSNPMQKETAINSSAWVVVLPWTKLALGALILFGLIIISWIIAKIYSKLIMRHQFQTH